MRTPAGRRELEEFVDAPLLMDGVRRNARGEDGEQQLNREELFRVAARDQVPVLGIAAYHDKPAKEKDLRCELYDEDDFRGLCSNLMLCIGAVVLLTSNCGCRRVS